MNIVIDGIAILGGLLLSAGVYLEYGLGFSLIAAGFFLFSLALVSANAQMVQMNASNS